MDEFYCGPVWALIANPCTEWYDSYIGQEIAFPLQTMTNLSYGPFITRAQAKEQGLTQYFVGTVCKRGHVQPHRITGGCLECLRSAQVTRRIRKHKEAESHINPWDQAFHKHHVPARFYTYAYLRPDGRPFYIGKGKGTRAWELHGSKVKRWSPPTADRVLILKWDMATDAEAFAHERYMIGIYGTAGKGWLTMNFTEGGDGTSGYEYTDELRQLRAEQMRGNSYGSRVDWTPQLRAKVSEATMGVKKTITAKVEAAHDRLNIRHNWQHPEHGKRFASCQEMAKETGYHQANFWRVREGKLQEQTHGWVCLDPLNVFKAKETDHVSRIGKAAATRVAKGAAELGITVEEYNALSYGKRSKLRKQMREAGTLVAA